MPFPALHVANSMLELQLLVHCLHGWHMAARDAPAVAESVEAWKYGPVAGSQYHLFRVHGSDEIDSLGCELRKGKLIAIKVSKQLGGFLRDPRKCLAQMHANYGFAAIFPRARAWDSSGIIPQGRT